MLSLTKEFERPWSKYPLKPIFNIYERGYKVEKMLKKTLEKLNSANIDFTKVNEVNSMIQTNIINKKREKLIQLDF